MLQEVLIPKKNFGLVSAIKWIVDRNYKFIKVSSKGEYYKFKQNPPNKFKHLYYKLLTNGIVLVMYE